MDTTLEILLEAARGCWDDDITQSQLSDTEREYLRGQAELIVRWSEGALSIPAGLFSHTSDLIAHITDLILPIGA